MSPNSSDIWAVIPAAGVGSRMQAELPKQYLPLACSTVLDVTLSKILSVPGLTGIVVALSEHDSWWKSSQYASHPAVFTCNGGRERSDSVLNALVRIPSLRTFPADYQPWVLVHDAARPCVTQEKIVELVNECKKRACGGILAAPASDTLKHVGAENEIQETIDRSKIWHAHTPQFFQYAELRSALEQCMANHKPVTDEASAVEQVNGKVIVVADRRDNIKITRPEDLSWAEFILQQQNYSKGF